MPTQFHVRDVKSRQQPRFVPVRRFRLDDVAIRVLARLAQRPHRFEVVIEQAYGGAVLDGEFREIFPRYPVVGVFDSPEGIKL